MDSRPHPRNVPGDFYVEAGKCISCCKPEREAPDLIRTEPDGCYFVRQPETEEELERAVRACAAACCGAVGYRGADPAIVDRIARAERARDSAGARDGARKPWWRVW